MAGGGAVAFPEVPARRAAAGPSFSLLSSVQGGASLPVAIAQASCLFLFVLHCGFLFVLHCGLLFVLHCGFLFVLHCGFLFVLHCGFLFVLHRGHCRATLLPFGTVGNGRFRPRFWPKGGQVFRCGRHRKTCRWEKGDRHHLPERPGGAEHKWCLSPFPVLCFSRHRRMRAGWRLLPQTVIGPFRVDRGGANAEEPKARLRHTKRLRGGRI